MKKKTDNLGIYNRGHFNAGNDNMGNWNTGDYNVGDYNVGNCNTGDHNTGNSNIGSENTGSCNIGDFNTGNWNKCSFSTGSFNTEEPNIMLFNKPSNMTHYEWLASAANQLLNRMPRKVIEHIDWEEDPNEKTAEYAQSWWDNLSNEDKNIILNIPNFDPDIFKECTGINVK